MILVLVVATIAIRIMINHMRTVIIFRIVIDIEIVFTVSEIFITRNACVYIHIHMGGCQN